MLGEYLPILLFLVVSTGLGIVLLVLGTGLGRMLGAPHPESQSEMLSPYECGFEPFEDARMQFDVRYYLIAIQFIIFDLEIAFVFPWAVNFRDLGIIGLTEMGLFVGLLVLGFVYVWKKGALEWE